MNCHTYYSLRYGTIETRRLLLLAKDNGVKRLVLTDINNTSACLDFVRMSSEFGLRPILGVDFRNGADQKFILIAKNNQGFQKINEYLSGFLKKEAPKVPDRCKNMSDCYIIYPFKDRGFEDLCENEFFGIKPQDFNILKLSKWNDKRDKLVALNTVSFENKRDFNIHRLPRAIDNNCLLSKLPVTEWGSETDRFLPIEKQVKVFADFPEIISNTENLLDNCQISFDFSRKTPNNKKSFTGDEVSDYKLLRKLAFEGIPYRYRISRKDIVSRVERELETIKDKGFVSYFLINWKILTYARSKGYFYVGRGSGANSIIAYLLRITDVDPIDLDLYFERFINLYRQNPPDFDIDFSWADRDDVIEYIFKEFENTALITVYNTFKFRAAIRELGKVFGLPKSEIDVLTTGKFNFGQLDQLSKLVVRYSRFIQGFPNYLGIHAGGILISEKPIHYFCATFMPPKGFPTTQFDMVVAEDIGLYKFDILSQRGLGKIKDAVEIVRENRPDEEPIDIHDIERFKKDKRIRQMLMAGNAIGCFYVESPAMRMLMKKTQVKDYLGLVAASSVIRPGVAKSGMMREYILRCRNPKRQNEAPKIFLELMPDTYGVMVYQEDVIKVAHHFGGLSTSEADLMRRGMSGKFKGRAEFLKVKDKFFENCKKDGKPLALVQDVWNQVESFGGYAFAKGHSASYAVESYQSLYLKAYYPLEYMVATINNGGGFYRAEFYIHEARMHGATIEAPCINTSNALAVIRGSTIYLGFSFLHSLEYKVIESLLKERYAEGHFESLEDFIDRVSISVEQMSILIKANAFRFTGVNKRELLWEAHLKISKIPKEEHVFTLFKSERISYKTPKLESTTLENAFDELELLGFPLCSPFKLLATSERLALRAKNLPDFENQTVTVEGYLITNKRTSTSNGKSMFFGNFLDYDGEFIDTVHFPPIAARFPFRGLGVYSITGRVTIEFDCVMVEVQSMHRLAMIEDPRYAENCIKKVS